MQSIVSHSPATSTSTPKRAALYPRVSDPGQRDNYSLGTQEEAMRAYAAEHGYTVDDAHVYREVFTGTELDERPELTRLRDAMARGEFDIMIAYDPDRFSRNMIHSAMMMYFCEKAGAELKFAMFDFENNPTGRLLLQLRVYAAEIEYEQRKERTRRGSAARTRACLTNHGASQMTMAASTIIAR